MKAFKIITLLLVFSFTSCDIMKKSQKNKEDISLKDSFEKKSYRPGDSVSYRPQINVKYKDTTIYRVTRNNTRLETVYDSNGEIRDINCYTDKIEELTRRNIELEESKKDKEQVKEEKFDSSFILYIISGIVMLGIVAMLLFFRSVNQNSAAIKIILKKLDGGTT